MRIVSLIARILLGLLFLIFGANGFFHFLHMPMPSGHAGEFLSLLFVTGYFQVVCVLQIICGVLLLVGVLVPLALTVAGAIIANILIYHGLMQPSGFPLAILALVLWLLAFWAVRAAFSSLFLIKTIGE